MTRAFRTSSLRRRNRGADGAAKMSRSSSTGSGVWAIETLPRGLRLSARKRCVNRRPIHRGRSIREFLVKLSVNDTEEIEHECEAAQSARSGRVVCRVGNLPRGRFRWRNGAERRRKTAGSRGAGEGQEGRKEGREERREKGREKGPASEVRPEDRIHHR